MLLCTSKIAVTLHVCTWSYSSILYLLLLCPSILVDFFSLLHLMFLCTSMQTLLVNTVDCTPLFLILYSSILHLYTCCYSTPFRFLLLCTSILVTLHLYGFVTLNLYTCCYYACLYVLYHWCYSILCMYLMLLITSILVATLCLYTCSYFLLPFTFIHIFTLRLYPCCYSAPLCLLLLCNSILFVTLHIYTYCYSSPLYVL